MLIENMKMAFSAIRANKMRSALTMLGIIIGIGSVISIVSIGDTMRGLFADLYKDVGITQAYFSIGYWVDDVRQSDYFNLDEMERAREAFSDQIAYIDSSAFTSDEASYKRTKIKFDYQGIDYNYQDVQPVNIVYGRYLNEGDILGRKKNVVMDTDSARMLFGVENAVGKTFRTTLYGSTDDFTVVGVYRKNINAFQALMMGGSNSDKGAAFIPYTLARVCKGGCEPGPVFQPVQILCCENARQAARGYLYVHSHAGDDLRGFHDGRPVHGGGWDCGHIPSGRRHRHHEHHAGIRDREDQGNRYQDSPGRQDP